MDVFDGINMEIINGDDIKDAVKEVSKLLHNLAVKHKKPYLTVTAFCNKKQNTAMGTIEYTKAEQRKYGYSLHENTFINYADIEAQT